MIRADETLACSFCHSDEYEMFFNAQTGHMVMCLECGYTTVATFEYLIAG